MIHITGETGLTGLLGSPVAHSISPLMHNYSFQSLGLDYVYLCFDVKEQGLKDAVQGLRALNVKGFNLTMPDKNKVLEHLDELSCAARLIGAVNTVENRDGRLIGHNTDGIGFMRSVAEQGLEMKGKTMTLLGAGGAATAICAQAALEHLDELSCAARLIGAVN
ncbi:MAG: shikimate dehydrogenase family protein, partial [Blautia hansenii]